MNILKYFLPLAIVFTTMGCNKSDSAKPKNGEVSIDSIEIHRVGGIAGFGDHFMISHNLAKKDTVKIRTTAKYEFNLVLPYKKLGAVVSILDHVPEAILTAPNPPYPGDPYPDMMAEWIVVYKSGRSNTLNLFNFPQNAEAYKSMVDNALNDLVQ